jgi:hypothetical protein
MLPDCRLEKAGLDSGLIERARVADVHEFQTKTPRPELQTSWRKSKSEEGFLAH